MKWGFLGIGRVTPRMVQAIRDSGGTIVAAAARDAAALEQWGRTHSVEKLTSDFLLLCNDPKIDAIYVALPPSLHLELASYALECGKRVLCEKPLTLNGAQAQLLAAKAANSDGLLSHATAFPHHPRSQKIRTMVMNGEIGEVQRVTIACSFSHVLTRGKDYRTSRELGGGSLLDLGWYCAFASMWFSGLKPVRIHGSGKRLDESGVWMANQGLVELETGAFGHWDCGFDATGRKWIEIAGTQGSIICDDFLRPWSLEKPRCWLHGENGKAQEIIEGIGVNQETQMVIDSADVSSGGVNDLLDLGVQTQRQLDAWESACETGASIPL